jgi:hypothetical protein
MSTNPIGKYINEYWKGNKLSRQERVAEAIKNVVSKMMDKVMVRVLEEDPFIKEKHHSSKPLYAALVPDEIFKGSHFERRFVTPSICGPRSSRKL